MQSNLVNAKITSDKILSSSFFDNGYRINEFIVYSDNILEGITLLNDLTSDDDYLQFYGVIYEPIDRPIYIFRDNSGDYYAIKICGCYDKWKLPYGVAKIINYVDLPDYIIYSLSTEKVVIAGENTETASVGNSQWQREGRKLGAARTGVPFVYQTFYSGRDESQNKIREPSSLQVYNHLVYSVRYKTPSFVVYFENNFDNSSTRVRQGTPGQKLLGDYIKVSILASVHERFVELKKAVEYSLYMNMLSYLSEIKYSDFHKSKAKCRLYKDMPFLSPKLYDDLIKGDKFVAELIDYLYETDQSKAEEYLSNSMLLGFDFSKYGIWSFYDTKLHISELISYLHGKNAYPRSYLMSGKTKVGLADLKLCKTFLKNKFPSFSQDIDRILDETKYSDVVVMPLRIHKKSKGELTFSPDPESGEIVAFSELFGFDLKGNKTRPVIGYCIVDTPSGFSLKDKSGTKLYKALSEYVDVLVMGGSELIYGLSYNKTSSDHVPTLDEKPSSTTEESAVVSTFLSLTTINSDWQLCFIHTHHSSWQQLVINCGERHVQQKIDRVSTKVDLIMQKRNLFMIAEGKNGYYDIIKDPKIKYAMRFASDKIDELYGGEAVQFDAFVYNLDTVPSKDPEFYAQKEVETVESAISMGHFDDIAFKEFVVIIVYTNSCAQTAFRLVYSHGFDASIKSRLNEEFRQ